ncbi:two-component sensor histidine kinase [Babesia caballi]|uniref:Two-component sensor histidine kinase n=1 Tax=Babesia caballi TaxID=5871 RepID=A0AAV4LY64_BABCB|nr:two-component sensor histidine kinase [Babesia caballi]
MGKKSSRRAADAPGKCVRKAGDKGRPSSTPGGGSIRGGALLRWLYFELRLLQRLVYRVSLALSRTRSPRAAHVISVALTDAQNKNQHRSSAFMAAVCHSVRDLKRFTAFCKRRSGAALSALHTDAVFNRLFYLSIRSVLGASAEISRIHAHHFHVPLIATLLGVFG